MLCKKCNSGKFVKNGKKPNGLQRYKCKECGCVFTDTPPRGKPAPMKALAILLYTMCNCTFGMIGRLLGVSDVSILRWVKEYAKKLPAPSSADCGEVIILDEMWHFVNGKKTRFGSRRPMTLFPIKLLSGNLVGVIAEL